MNHGTQLAVDITLRSGVTANGRACPNAATVGGAVLSKARLDKETKYAELVESDRCQLVVVGIETGDGGPMRPRRSSKDWLLRVRVKRPHPFFIISRLAEEVVPHAVRVVQQGILWVFGLDCRRSVDSHRRRCARTG